MLAVLKLLLLSCVATGIYAKATPTLLRRPRRWLRPTSYGLNHQLSQKQWTSFLELAGNSAAPGDPAPTDPSPADAPFDPADESDAPDALNSFIAGQNRQALEARRAALLTAQAELAEHERTIRAAMDEAAAKDKKEAAVHALMSGWGGGEKTKESEEAPHHAEWAPGTAYHNRTLGAMRAAQGEMDRALRVTTHGHRNGSLSTEEINAHKKTLTSVMGRLVGAQDVLADQMQMANAKAQQHALMLAAANISQTAMLLLRRGLVQGQAGLERGVDKMMHTMEVNMEQRFIKGMEHSAKRLEKLAETEVADAALNASAHAVTAMSTQINVTAQAKIAPAAADVMQVRTARLGIVVLLHSENFVLSP